MLMLAPQTLEIAHVACLGLVHASCIILPRDCQAHAGIGCIENAPAAQGKCGRTEGQVPGGVPQKLQVMLTKGRLAEVTSWLLCCTYAPRTSSGLQGW